MTCILRRLATALLICACWLAAADTHGGGPQFPGPAPGQPGGPQPGVSPASSKPPPPPEPGLHIFEHILAIAGAGAVLLVVCTPSRKRF